MEFVFESLIQVTFEHNKGEDSSVVKSVNFNLELSDNLNRRDYIKRDGLPTEAGVHSLNRATLAGLASIIQYAHHQGFKDKDQSLKEVIHYLTNAVDTGAKSFQSTFKKI